MLNVKNYHELKNNTYLFMNGNFLGEIEFFIPEKHNY